MRRRVLVASIVAAVGLFGCGSDGSNGGAAGTGGAGGDGGTGGAGGSETGIPTQGLEAFYSFEGDASDQSNAGNDATLGGGATADGELVMGDNDTDFLSVPSAVLDGLVDFTVAAWVRLDVLRNENRQLISGANAQEDNALLLWYREQTDEWLVGINSGDSAFAVDSTIEDMDWHHVALVRSGTSAVLYLDGAQLGDPVVVPGDALDVDPGGLIFGQDQDEVGGGFDAGESWAGSLDNLRIYNRALSQAEVALVAAEPR